MRRICLRLYSDDIEEIEKLAKASGKAFNVLARQIVHTYIVQAGAKLRAKIDELEKNSA